MRVLRLVPVGSGTAGFWRMDATATLASWCAVASDASMAAAIWYSKPVRALSSEALAIHTIAGSCRP